MTLAERPTIPERRYGERLARAGTAVESAGLTAMLIGVGPDLRYLTGYAAIGLERLTMLVVRPAAEPLLVVPRLERGAAEAGVRTTIRLQTWEETEDPFVLVSEGISRDGRIAVSDGLPAMHLLRLEEALGSASRFTLASAILRDLRMIKDPDEIALLRAAAHAADRVIVAVSGGRLVGRTEQDVAREVRDRLVAEGHESASFAIVGSGPNSASPHHDASDRVIQPGEPIVLDIGGTYGGYGSDVTRTLWATGGDAAKRPDARFAELFKVLYEAQAYARTRVRPNVPCEVIDAAARSVIEAAGHGEAFFHRTGHGIGLEGHEEPYLVAGNDLLLRAGMAFSVEPGIYYPDEYGARIEDIVVCGDDGPVVLNEAARELAVVDG